MSAGEFWDKKFGPARYLYGTSPNAFIESALPPRLLAGAQVLCVGDGEGRNGVWLAARGDQVTSVDPSSAGVEKAHALAAERGVVIDARVDSLPSKTLTSPQFDAVVLVYVHTPPHLRRPLHHAALALLKPGGWLFLEAFAKDQLGRRSGGPQNVEMLFDVETLAADFAGLEIEQLEQIETRLDEGPGHRGEALVVRLIGRRAKTNTHLDTD